MSNPRLRARLRLWWMRRTQARRAHIQRGSPALTAIAEIQRDCEGARARRRGELEALQKDLDRVGHG